MIFFAVVVAAGLQSLLAFPLWLGHAPMPLLAGVVVYYALTRDTATLVGAALLAGLAQDTLALTPLGYTAFAYVVAALLIQQSRDVVVASQWTTHVLFGALTAAGSSLAVFLLLAKDGAVQVPWWFLVLRVLGGLATGAVTGPLAFAALAALERSQGRPLREEAL